MSSPVSSLEFEGIVPSQPEVGIPKGEFERSGDEIIDTSIKDIMTAESEVTSALHLEPGSPMAIAATDNFLIHRAESLVGLPKQTTETAAAITDVGVEGTLESLGVRTSLGENPLKTFEDDGNTDALTALATQLHADHAMLHTPNGSIEVGVALAEAIDKLNEHPVMQEPGSVEYVEKKSLELAIEEAKKNAERLAEGGIERSAFRGMEVERAIQSYYADHEVTLAVLNSVAEGVPLTDGVHPEITNELMREATAEIIKGTASEELIEATIKLLYCEPSIGQLTLDDATIERIAQEKVKLNMALTERGKYYPERVSSVELEKRGIESTAKEAQNEVRNAGQLLFHNSVYGKEIRQQGNIRGRHQQLSTQGVVRLTTADLPKHAVVPHWSEVYDEAGYKRAAMQNQEVPEGAQAVTYAVPISEVIQRAPYARGLEYATVDAKGLQPDLATVTSRNGKVTGEIGPGQMDHVGSKNLSIDRIFSSASSMQEGSEYDVPVNGKDIMRWNPDKNYEEAVVYEIQSNNDRFYNFSDKNRHATPEEISQMKSDLANYGQNYLINEHGAGIEASGTGRGYGYPGRVTIEDRVFDDSSTQVPQPQFEKPSEASEAYIQAIESESANRYKGEYVVPLRAAATEFMSYGDNTTNNAFGQNVARLLRQTREQVAA